MPSDNPALRETRPAQASESRGKVEDKMKGIAVTDVIIKLPGISESEQRAVWRIDAAIALLRAVLDEAEWWHRGHICENDRDCEACARLVALRSAVGESRGREGKR